MLDKPFTFSDCLCSVTLKLNLAAYGYYFNLGSLFLIFLTFCVMVMIMYSFLTDVHSKYLTLRVSGCSRLILLPEEK